MSTPPLHGNLKSTEAENREHDPSVFAKRVVVWPDNTQQRIDTNGRSDNQPVYIGFAVPGLLTSDNGWMIQQWTYTLINGQYMGTLRQIAYDTWDNRTGASYS